MSNHLPTDLKIDPLTFYLFKPSRHLIYLVTESVKSDSPLELFHFLCAEKPMYIIDFAELLQGELPNEKSQMTYLYLDDAHCRLFDGNILA